MADSHPLHPPHGPTLAADPRSPVLLVLIVASPGMLDEIVTILLDFGIGGTVVESKGLAAVLRAEMPIFSGLASLLPESTSSRIVFSLATRAQADKALDFIREGLNRAQRPIGFILSLDRVVGLRL